MQSLSNFKKPESSSNGTKRTKSNSLSKARSSLCNGFEASALSISVVGALAFCSEGLSASLLLVLGALWPLHFWHKFAVLDGLCPLNPQRDPDLGPKRTGWTKVGWPDQKELSPKGSEGQKSGPILDGSGISKLFPAFFFREGGGGGELHLNIVFDWPKTLSEYFSIFGTSTSGLASFPGYLGQVNPM